MAVAPRRHYRDDHHENPVTVSEIPWIRLLRDLRGELVAIELFVRAGRLVALVDQFSNHSLLEIIVCLLRGASPYVQRGEAPSRIGKIVRTPAEGEGSVRIAEPDGSLRLLKRGNARRLTLYQRTA